jgi:hypothetical protein
MFSVNNTTSIVLFDSAAYVERHNILVAMLKCRMIVSSPRGDMPARQVCPKVKIILRGGERVQRLIVIDSKGIDVILEMD